MVYQNFVKTEWQRQNPDKRIEDNGNGCFTIQKGFQPFVTTT